MAQRQIVFDAWPILEFLTGGPAAQKVEAMLLDAQRADTTLWVTAVNLGEVWYATARRKTEAAADQVMEGIRLLGFHVREADWELSREAARLKATAKRRLSFADCYAAGLAKVLQAEVVTGDPEFRQLEPDVRVRWL